MSESASTVKMPSTDLFWLAKESLSKSGKFTFVSRGYSMYPSICHREKVTLTDVEFSELKAGDVIFCITCDGPLLHRIETVTASPPEVVIRGDAHNSTSHTVNAADIAGRIDTVHKRPLCRLKKIMSDFFTDT